MFKTKKKLFNWPFTSDVVMTIAFILAVFQNCKKEREIF